MEQILNKIRQKPEKVKRQILYIAVVGLGIILVLLWIYSLGVTFTNPATVSGVKQDINSINNSLQNSSPSIPSSW